MHHINTDYDRRLFERLRILDPIHVIMSARVHRQTLFGDWLARLFGSQPLRDRELVRRAF